MEKLFIEPGTEAEFVLGCELAEVHGNHTGNPIMGAVGGPLGQIFIVLSVFKSLNIEGTDKFWKKRQLLSFLCAYVAQQTKAEIFTFMFDKWSEEWMEKHEIKFEDFFKKIKGAISQEFREIIKDREEGMMNRYI